MKPWMSRNLVDIIKKRTNYHILWKNGKIGQDFYRRYRNMVTGEIRRKRADYYTNLFDSIRGNIGSVWKHINKLVRPTVSEKTNGGIRLKLDDTLHEDSHYLAERMNEYFSTIGSNINNSFDGSVGRDFHSYLGGSSVNSLFLNPVTEAEVRDVIMSLKSKSINLDSVPVKVIKYLSPIISGVLSFLINKCFLDGKFPDIFKTARIVPIYKGGDAENISNYRPISILNNFSKIFEKCMYRRLYSYLCSNNILSERQFGFRRGKCTMQAIVNFLKPVYHELDDGNLVFALFLDFKKAFDCVPHHILLGKMHFHGIRGIPLELFTSYLSGRKQFTVVNGCTSSLAGINCGVPQGSTLGPLLFLVFINDLLNSTPFFNFNLFADDSVVSCSFPRQRINDFHTTINEKLAEIYQWLCANRIKLNVSKTKYVIFSYRGEFQLNSIHINQSEIENVKCIRYLGLCIDNNLRFDEHINTISTKVARSVGILGRIRELIPMSVAKMIYFALVYPYFDYCITIWGNTAGCYLNKLILLQKRAIRILAGVPYLHHTDELFNDFKILKICDLYRYNVGLYMYRTLNLGNYDAELSAYVSENSDRLVYTTRNNLSIRLPRYKCESSKSSVFYTSSKLWNELPLAVKSSESVNIFKRRFKLQLN